jgi:aryl-alcohol dehydrogenase-like predicted oxidoreductase
VRALGVCNLSAAQMREWMEHAPLHSCQARYSLFHREVEAEVLPFCREHGLLFLAYSPLARGLLTGGMTEGLEPSDEARDEPMFHGEEYIRHLLAVERLGHYAEEIYDKRVIDLAIRWVLDRSGGVALWGARRPSQLEPLPGIWGWRLDAPGFVEIDATVDEALDAKAVRRAVPRM